MFAQPRDSPPAALRAYLARGQQRLFGAPVRRRNVAASTLMEDDNSCCCRRRSGSAVLNITVETPAYHS